VQGGPPSLCPHHGHLVFLGDAKLFLFSSVLPYNHMKTVDSANPGDDEVLLNRVRKGEIEAFALLVNRYQVPLFGFLYRMIKDREAAQDLAQETFVKVFQSLNDYSGRNQAAFSTWLFAIARNGCLDLMRRHKRNATESLDDHEDLTNPELGDPARRLRIRAEMERALRELNPNQRMAFELTVVEGFDYEDAAEILHSTAGSIRSRVHRAREFLQSRLRVFVEKG
jgi:RNA polymerase sigma-70 factor, ECF subfamily